MQAAAVNDHDPDTWPAERFENATDAMVQASGMMFLRATPEERLRHLIPGRPADLIRDAATLTQWLRDALDRETAA